MVRLICLALLLLLPLSAQADDTDGNMIDPHVDLPDGRHFDLGIEQAPVFWLLHPFIGTPVIHRISRADTEKTCSPLGFQPLGCTMGDLETCHIYISTEVDPQVLAYLIQHELAHCRGWPADHYSGMHFNTWSTGVFKLPLKQERPSPVPEPMGASR